MKVLHVLETSLPDTGGYTIRAQSIVEQQRRMGMEVVVVTSPLFPCSAPPPASEMRDGIRYYRTNHVRAPSAADSRLTRQFRRFMMLRGYSRAVREIVRKERPDIVHAHSSYGNALAAAPVARAFGLPLVYEVRTLWGESAVIEDGLKTGSLKYRTVWWLELRAMRKADAVVPIARGIREELLNRGVPAAKMSIVPNGVDSAKFLPREKNHTLARMHGLDGSFVVGFIGTMRRLEGLSTLVRAYAKIRSSTNFLKLVIVGDGPDRPDLQSLAKELGVPDVLFTGTVPHDEVAAWYSIMDVLVYPRIRATINERVTPLKPLEAMALGKVCVGSDVGGLMELIEHDQTGVIFPSEDATALAALLLDLSQDPARMSRLRQAAMQFVARERSWSAIIQKTDELYRRLIQDKSR